jgi:hypothetical protein
MAIVQISKIQQRSGNLVDLPQLDEAEFGFASDAKRLFIGKTVPNENIEVLTSYSNIAFSQVEGSVGNLDISAVNLADGQVLAYDGSNWVNRGGAAGGLIDLGSVSNVTIDGGAIGYVLQTDGVGNLSWTPKGTLYTNIVALSNANPIVMTVANTTPYTNGQSITISGVTATNANTVVNGLTFYVKLATNFATSGNVTLYTDSTLVTPKNGSTLGQPTSGGIATAVVTSGSSSAGAGGTTNSVQYNVSGVLVGDSNFLWDTSTLTVNGNANVGNLNATTSITGSTLTSNVATGTAPITVTSTTRVSNLSVAYSNVSDFGVTTLQTTGTFYPVFANGSATANRALGANANLSFNAATGALSATLFTGTLTTAAQPNVTSVGTLTSVAVTGNANVGNLNTAGNVLSSRLVSNVATGTAPLTVTSTTRVANLSVAYANVSDFGVVTAQSTGTYYPTFINGSSTGNYALAANSGISANLANGSITATTFVGNVSGNISGNIQVSGSNTQVLFNDSGNANATSGLTFNKSTNVLTVTANVISGNVYANSGTVGGSLLTGTLTTAAQPNVTSLGTLTSLGVNGTVTAVNITANTGVFTGNGSALNSLTGSNVTGQVGNALIAGTVYTAAQPNITSTGTLTGLNVASGSITAITPILITQTWNNASVAFTGIRENITDTASAVASLLFDLQVGGVSKFSVQKDGNIAGGNLTVGTTGTVILGALTTGANTNSGNITGNWSLTAGSKLNATYADLAEYYAADADYPPGTVLEFGGEQEVTIGTDGTTRVAGVISTNPAYAMNAKCPGDHVVAIALQGRVPCKVRGTIRKGDMLISAGDGFARPSNNPIMGSVIGKALQSHDGIEGVIEVAVGRL